MTTRQLDYAVALAISATIFAAAYGSWLALMAAVTGLFLLVLVPERALDAAPGACPGRGVEGDLASTGSPQAGGAAVPSGPVVSTAELTEPSRSPSVLERWS